MRETSSCIHHPFIFVPIGHFPVHFQKYRDGCIELLVSLILICHPRGTIYFHLFFGLHCKKTAWSNVASDTSYTGATGVKPAR